MQKKSIKRLVSGVALTGVLLGVSAPTFASTQTIPFTITVQETGKGFTINNNGSESIKIIQDTETAFNLQGRTVGKYRNANKIGVTVTNDQNGGEAGQMYATLKSVDGKLTETTGTAPTAGQVSVFTKGLDGSDVQLVEGTEVALGTLAGNDTQDLDFDIYLPA